MKRPRLTTRAEVVKKLKAQGRCLKCVHPTHPQSCPQCGCWPTKGTPDPKRGRSIRFTDAEWAEIKLGAQALGETRSEAIRAGGLPRVRQAIADVSDVTLGSVAAPARQMFVCGWCGAEFANEADALWHMDKAHQGES